MRESGSPTMCSVCHERIHILTIDDVSTWGHRDPRTNDDHSPRPVPADATAQNLCDFCSSTHPVWLFPTNGTGDWGACEPCRALIAADARDQLVERCYHAFAEGPELADLTEAEARQFVADVQQRYWESANGPGVPSNLPRR